MKKRPEIRTSGNYANTHVQQRKRHEQGIKEFSQKCEEQLLKDNDRADAESTKKIAEKRAKIEAKTKNHLARIASPDMSKSQKDASTRELRKLEGSLIGRQVIAKALAAAKIDTLKDYVEYYKRTRQLAKKDGLDGFQNRKLAMEKVEMIHGVDKKGESAPAGKVIEMVFHESFNPDGTGTQTVGVAVRTSSETD